MNLITSTQNPIVKELKLLARRKYREEKGLFFIEGIRFMEEAFKAQAEVEKIIVSERLEDTKGGKEILERLSEVKCQIVLLSEKVFNELSDTENPQGLLAVIKAKKYNIEDYLKNKGYWVILDSIQDPGNMGTIIRTADAAGMTGVIVSKGCVDIYNPKVLRSTMGSIFHIPIFFVDDLSDSIKQVKLGGIKVLAAHLNGTQNYFDIDLKENIAIIIGNEANGISNEVALEADVLVKIPMLGRAESLNASVAASLLMYETLRQRMYK